MTDPRNPLIVGVTNDASYRKDDNLPTSYAVNQLFSGETLDANVNANNITKSGTYRFNTTTTNLPSHLVGTSGLLTVMHERPTLSNANYGSAAAGTDYTPSVIRQIAWPDGPNDVTPYTRTKQNGVWGEWQTMGGNLRRVRLDNNVNALTNVMYYSFGNYILTLPNPSEYPLGTRIGLEQYNGTGSVKWENRVTNTTFTQGTTPAYAADEYGNPDTTNILGPNVYYFEIVEDSAEGSRIWLLDVDNDLAQTITDIRRNIELERSQRITAVGGEATARIAADNELSGRIDAEAATRGQADTALGGRIDAEASARTTLEDNINRTIFGTSSTNSTNKKVATYTDTAINTLIENETTNRTNADKNKERLSKVYTCSGTTLTGTTATTFADGTGASLTLTELLKVVNPTFVMTSSGKTVNLPAPSATYIGCHVNIEVPGSNHEVTVVAGSASEKFTNTTGATLLLPFECVMIAENSYIWNLLVIA